jgi:abelson tyrosine-protein kinase 1
MSSVHRNQVNFGECLPLTTKFPPELGGPSYHEEIPGNCMANCQSANKVSMVGGSDTWDTVLLAPLRFKPDVSEPTSL